MIITHKIRRRKLEIRHCLESKIKNEIIIYKKEVWNVII